MDLVSGFVCMDDGETEKRGRNGGSISLWVTLLAISHQTGRDVPPLTDNERVVRVYTGDGIFKV